VNIELTLTFRRLLGQNMTRVRMTTFDLSRGGRAKALRGAFMGFEFWHNSSINLVDSGEWGGPPPYPFPTFFLFFRENNWYLHAFYARSELGRAAFGQVFLEPVEQLNAEFLVRDLASPESDRRLHFVSIGQNLLGMLHLEIVVVLIGHRTELDLFDLDDDLFLLGFVRSLFLLVKILAEINDATNRRLGLGRDFDQIVAALTRDREGLLRRHDAHLLPIFVNHSH